MHRKLWHTKFGSNMVRRKKGGVCRKSSDPIRTDEHQQISNYNWIGSDQRFQHPNWIDQFLDDSQHPIKPNRSNPMTVQLSSRKYLAKSFGNKSFNRTGQSKNRYKKAKIAINTKNNPPAAPTYNILLHNIHLNREIYRQRPKDDRSRKRQDLIKVWKQHPYGHRQYHIRTSKT